MQIQQPITLTASAPTAGGLTASTSGSLASVINKYSWTNAMVVALGASLTGDLTVCTLPAKTLVKSIRVVITGQAASLTACTFAVGKTSALYIDYIVANDLKSVAGTVFGNAFADLGTGLSALVGSLPSLTTTTAVKMHLISAVENLSATTASIGDIYIETLLLP